MRSWDVRFIWGPNDWEADAVEDFLHILDPNIPSSDDGDCMRWKLMKNGDFDIRSFYNKLRGSSSIGFPWKGIWKVKAPRRVSFFVWISTWDKILIGDNLQSRGFEFVDWCIMCRRCEETVDHLLLPCEKAHWLWCSVFRSFGISWVLLGLVADLLFDLWNWLRKYSSNIWNLVPLCLMRCIWKQCCWQAFEDIDRSDDQLLASFSGTLFDWSKAWGLTSSDSIPLFL